MYAEQIFKEVQKLPDVLAREVLDFVGTSKSSTASATGSQKS